MKKCTIDFGKFLGQVRHVKSFCWVGSNLNAHAKCQVMHTIEKIFLTFLT